MPARPDSQGWLCWAAARGGTRMISRSPWCCSGTLRRFGFTPYPPPQYNSGIKPPLLLAFALFLLASSPAPAGSGTWILNPISSDWNTAANWSSNTVPGPLDIATFAVSNQTEISITDGSSVGQVVFQGGASAYQIAALSNESLTVLDGGIDNESGIVQKLTAKGGDSGQGALIQLERGPLQGALQFTSEATSISDGLSGIVWVLFNANAGTSNFINNGGLVAGVGGGQTNFVDAQASSATIINKAALVEGAGGGLTMFWNQATAGQAAITSEGATVVGAGGGITRFIDSSRRMQL